MAAVVTSPLARTAAAQTGAVAGVVVTAEAGGPLGYSVVAAPSLKLERFTDDSGRFVLRDVPAGDIRLQIRHIGYVPQDVSVSVRGGETTDIRVVLTHVPVTLAAVKVNQRPACTNPGPPSAVTDSALAALFEQLEQNAQQYRLISTRYPFTSVVERQFGYDPAPPSTLFRPDTIPVESDAPWTYEPGHIVVRDPASFTGAYAVRIPTLAVFADRAFLDSHCFWSEGIVRTDSERLLRIDFEAAERIQSPDLNGSMYLDPSSFVIRRSVIRLSRYSREIEEFDSVSVETRFAEAVPGVPVISEIDGRSHYQTPRTVRGHEESANLEHQRVVALRFSKGMPGQTESNPADAKRSHKPVVLWLARVLGVFDAETGAPLAGATVRDSLSGRGEVTSTTGTLRLTFMPRSTGLLTIRKPGYVADTLTVRLSLADTTPITVILRRAAATASDSARTPAAIDTTTRPEQHRLATAGALAVMRVLVRTGGAPLGDASVVIREEGVGAIIVGRADSNGFYGVAAPLGGDGKRYAVTARKIGYAPASVPIDPRPGDTVTVTLALQHSAMLDTVRVTASQLPSKDYMLDGAEITRSTRSIHDALDAVAKLRPQMLGDGGRGCPVVKNVWVNGTRVWWQIPRPGEPPAPMVVHIPRILVDEGYESVLQRIKPEHIAQMRYANCWDTSVPEIGTDNALYITLKPGIEWDWDLGSHPADQPKSPPPSTGRH